MLRNYLHPIARFICAMLGHPAEPLLCTDHEPEDILRGWVCPCGAWREWR